jgi:hypothetical protein
MARRKGTSRVTQSGGSRVGDGDGEGEPRYNPSPELPSIRSRRPVLYWTTVIAVLAMVLSTVASFALAFT